MQTFEVLMIVAVLLGPVLAVQMQKLLERRRGYRQRRLDVFLTLMGTRMARVSAAHVEALNRIDLEFYGETSRWRRKRAKKFKRTREAWASYREQLNTPFSVSDSAQFEAWSKKKDDLFVALLYEMSESLGYEFDRETLRRAIYAPVAHREEEALSKRIKSAMADVLEGKKPLKIAPEP